MIRLLLAVALMAMVTTSAFPQSSTSPALARPDGQDPQGTTGVMAPGYAAPVQIPGGELKGYTNPKSVADELLKGRKIQTFDQIGNASQPRESVLGRSLSEAGLTLVLLLVAIVVTIAEVWIIVANKWDSDASIKLIGLSLVIFGGLFLITAGYAEQQMSAMMGILGTLAGHLMTREAKARR